MHLSKPVLYKISGMGLDIRKGFRAALIQLKVCADRCINLENAAHEIHEAKKCGAQLISLPECFNSCYGLELSDKFAENIPNGPTCKMLSKAAKDNSVYVVGGTFQEGDNSRLYNTCTVWDPEGNMIAKYRKMHLFDINIPGRQTHKESDVFSPGNELSSFCMFNNIKVGIGICYDIRFEELAKLYRLQGCNILIYPGAFTMTTGPLHWELLQRARALDNQVFVFGISSATGNEGYVAWGHSQVTNPWGKVIAQAGHNQEIIYCDIDLTQRDQVRQQIPIYHQRRTDIYATVCVKK